MLEEMKLGVATYVFESRSPFREVCTLMEKVGQTLEFRDGQIWLENEVLKGVWQSIWSKVKGGYVEAWEN